MKESNGYAELDGGRHIRFVSDLHLGHSGGKVRTVEQFGMLVEGCEVFVVCGDFYESRPCRYREEALVLKKAFEEVCRQKGVELVALSGNHDPDERQVIAGVRDQGVVALHGHEMFPQVAPWGREYIYHKKKAWDAIRAYPNADRDLDECLERARALSLFVPPVIHERRKSRIPLYDLARNACSPPTRAFRILWAWLTMRRRIRNFADRFFPGSKLVCYGHMHRRDVCRKDGRIYVNMGALFKHAHAYGVDLMGNLVTVREVSADGWGKEVARFDLNG